MRKQWLIIPLMVAALSTYGQDAVEGDVTGVGETNIADTNLVEQPIAEDSATTNDMVGEDTNTDEIAVQEIVAAPAEETNTVVTVGYTLEKDGVLYASPNARFGIEGMDDLSGIKEIYISLDGGVYAPYRGAVSFLKEGDHTINYKFIDQVGNISYSKTFDVTIDATAPRVLEHAFNPAPYLASGYTYVGPNTELTFTAYDDLTGVAYVEYTTNTEAEWQRYSTNIALSEVGATNTGFFTLYYNATDSVSNVSSVKTTTVFVDATAPIVDVYTKAFEKDGVRYISLKDIIYVDAFDAETKVQTILYAINDGEFQEYNPQIAIRLTEAGSYDIKAKAIDVVGNVSEEFVYSVVIDAEAPVGDVSYIGDEESKEYDETQALGTVEEPLTDESATTSEEMSAESSEEMSTEVDMNGVATEDGVVVNPSEEVPAGEVAPQ